MNLMKKEWLGKIVAVLLVIVMMFSGSPVLISEAQDNTEVSADASEAENDDNSSHIETEQKQENQLNYLYLGNNYIEGSGTQNVMVSWGNGSENISEMKLFYMTPGGTEEYMQAERNEDNTWLFTREFADAGIYTLLRLVIGLDGETATYDLIENNMVVKFGVNEEVTDEVVSDHFDMESYIPEEESVETSVVALTENGEGAAESISAALGTLDEKTETDGPSILSNSADEETPSTRSSNLVIVLDPGHDASHTGATGNGVKEEVATLKIAQYCKEELEKYSGVTVYMTRESAACPFPETIGVASGNVLDIKKRVDWAASLGADAFISFHLNSSVSSSANGAQVFYPDASFAGSAVENEGAALANKIQQELIALGLNKRSNESADYTVNTQSAKYGFPGLIIEHAFVSNSSDAANFLNSDAKLKKLGVADAEGIIKYYGLTKESFSEVDEGTYTISTAVNTDKVITAGGTEIRNGTSVSVYGKMSNSQLKSTTQRFEIIDVGEGYYKIVSEASDLVFDIKNGSADLQTDIQLFEWNDSSAQKWRFVDAGNGYYYIKSALGTYLNLKAGNASDGNGIWTYTNDKTNACKWKLEKSDYQPVADGTYTISTSLDAGQVVDVEAGSILNCANIRIYESNNSSAQRFEVTYVGNSYYKIVSEKSGRSLDIASGLRIPGNNVQQYDWNDSDAQLWKFVKLEDGSYYIKSKTGLVLDLHAADFTNGSNVDVYTFNGTGAQKWRLSSAEYRNIENGTYVIRDSETTFDVVSAIDSQIKLSTFSNTKNQKYEITYVENSGGYYKIINQSNGLALDVIGASEATGVYLQEYEYNGSNAQLWKFIDNGSGGYYLKSKCGTFIEASNSRLKTNLLDGSAEQTWTLDENWASMDEAPVEDGIYNIQSTINSNKVIDIAGASVSDQANVQIFTKNDTDAQQFIITEIEDGYYKIESVHSGKVLDIAAASANPGANIWQYTWNGSDAQLWRFLKADDESYYIQSKLGTVIDLAAGNTYDGNNIDAYTMNGTEAQKWKLKEVSQNNLADGVYSIRSSGDDLQVLTSVSGDVKIQTFDNTSSQKYEIAYVKESGFYKIVNSDTGKVLTVEGDKANNASNLIEDTWKKKDSQLWNFENCGNGQYYIVSKLDICIDVQSGIIENGSNVWLYQKNGTAAQKWILDSNWGGMEEKNIAEDTYVITSRVTNGKVLDVAGASMADTANVQIFQSNKTSSQRFEIEYVSNGYYKIVSELSGKVLDVSGGVGANGKNVWLYEWNGSDAQLWKFIEEDGTYYIKSKLGLVLDVAGANTYNGANVDIYTWNKTNAQKWVLQKAVDKVVAEDTYVIYNTRDAFKVLTSVNSALSLSTFDNTAGQKYIMTYISGGYYSIMNKETKKVLEVSAEGEIKENTWKNTEKQLWKFVVLENDSYLIKAKDGSCLSLTNDTLSEGSAVITAKTESKDLITWKLSSQMASYSEANIVDNGTYYLQTKLTDNMVLNIANSSKVENANAELQALDQTAAQRYEITYVGDGYYKIIAEHSDKALTVENGNFKNSQNVSQYSWENKDAQLWKFIPDGNGSYYIKTKSSQVLDVRGAAAYGGSNVQIYALNGSNAQKWTLKESDYRPIADGEYVTFSKLNANKVMDIENGWQFDGALVQIYDSNGTDAQIFVTEYQGKGYYKIVSKLSLKVLSVVDGKNTVRAKIEQRTWNGDDSQLWKFVDCNDGTFYIKSKLGTVIEIPQGNLSAGTKLQMNYINDSSSQKWAIYNPEQLYEIMGEGFTNVSQMAAYYRSKTNTYPYAQSDAPTIEDFCQIYMEECEAEGVKTEVAFCQAMLETGFLKFGGDVKPEQNNFAGLGATGGGEPGETFASVRIGIRAHVQHLKAYGSTESLNQECVDTRFKYVTRGCAPYVEWLGQKENPTGAGWATSVNYGYNILKSIQTLISY